MTTDNALQGQVALVTGAARGIGASAAELLAAPAPAYVDESTDAAIREKFNILLPRQRMNVA